MQALLGGSFEDGALAGFAIGLADLTSANLEGSIAKAVAGGALDAGQAASARMFARVLGSAIRAAGSPDDPSHAFAGAFLGDVIKLMGPQAAPTAVADPGATTPQIAVAVAAAPAEAAPVAGNPSPPEDPPAQAPPIADNPSPPDPAAQAPSVAGEAAASPVQTVPPPPNQVVVRPGDSLYRIAAGLAGAGASAAQINDLKNQLAAANPQLIDLNRLRPGQTLNLPALDTALDAFTLARLAAADAQYQAQRQADPQPPVYAEGTLTPDHTGPSFLELVGTDLPGEPARSFAELMGTDLPGEPDPSFAELVGRALPGELARTGVVVQGNTATVGTAGAALVMTWEGGAAGADGIAALNALVRLAALPLAGLTVLFSPTNETQQWVDLGEGFRFRTRPGELYGTLERQQPDGRWKTEGKAIRPDQISDRNMLTPEQRVRLRAPITTPLPPPAGPSVIATPPVSEEQRELTEAPTMTPGEPQAPVALPGTPAEPQSWQDLLIEQSNADNNRDMAAQRYRDNPSLQDPTKLAGTQVSGIGTWGYPTQPRVENGRDYQEQLNGIPAGLEINVGGQVLPDGTITGGAWIDGVEVRDGRVVMIDRKDWAGYPPSGADFWHSSVTNELDRQLREAGQIGATVEMQFSTQRAADEVQKLVTGLAKEDDRFANVNIRVVPKK